LTLVASRERAVARIRLPAHVNCPYCQVQNPPSEERCAACGRDLTLYIGPVEHFPRRLDLGSLMLLIAVVAVCLGVTREAPPLGVFLLVVAVPALLRTLVWVARFRQDGRPMLWPEKLGAFAASLGIVWLIVVGALAASGVGLALGASLGAGLDAMVYGSVSRGVFVAGIGISLGCVAGVAGGYFLARLLWPIKD
jgi:hypothetical protein